MVKAKKNAAKKISKAQKSAKSATKAQNASQKPQMATLDDCYRKGGYWASIQGLRKLGIGKMHDLKSAVAAVKAIMVKADLWKPFAAKKGKLTADERLAVNLMVTSREDYGQPVRAAKHEVVWDGRAKKVGLMKLGK